MTKIKFSQKFFFLSFIFFLLTLSELGFCEGKWELVWDPASLKPPISTGVHRIQFINPREGWALGKDILLHTKDGGVTWQKVEMEIQKIVRNAKDIIFRDMFFTSHSHGFIVGEFSIIDEKGLILGEKGLILVTSDGGKTWEQQESGVNKRLMSVFFTSEQEGWAVGFSGILHTKNGGKRWEVQKESNFYLSSVDFVDSKTGWVGGKLGVLLHTNDGGETWEEQKTGVDYWFLDLDLLSEKEGWMVGVTTFPNLNLAAPGAVLHTKDGGKTWERIVEFNKVWCQAVFFVNQREGWIGGSKKGQREEEWENVIYHTSDGGGTWEIQLKTTQGWGASDFAYNGVDTVWSAAKGIWKYTDPSLRISAVKPDSKLLPTFWGKLKTAVYQNYPNPFNPETWIPYQLAQASFVTIRIYNVKGQLVRELVLGEKPAGTYLSKDKAARWDGKDSTGKTVASGVYFYTLKAGEYTATRKLVVLK